MKEQAETSHCSPPALLTAISTKSCLLFYQSGIGNKMGPFLHAEVILQLSEMWSISPEEKPMKMLMEWTNIWHSNHMWYFTISNKDWSEFTLWQNFINNYFWRPSRKIVCSTALSFLQLLTPIHLFLPVLCESHNKELKEEEMDCLTELTNQNLTKNHSLFPVSLTPPSTSCTYHTLEGLCLHRIIE